MGQHLLCTARKNAPYCLSSRQMPLPRFDDRRPDKGQRNAEVQGVDCVRIVQALQQRIGEIYSPECRADLGDARCKVDLSAFTRTGTVTSATDRAVFFAAVDGATADGWFDGGALTFTSGQNAGKTTEVKSWTASSGRIELFLAVGYAIAAGDWLTGWWVEPTLSCSSTIRPFQRRARARVVLRLSTPQRWERPPTTRRSCR
jgi:hypothetical protein